MKKHTTAVFPSDLLPNVQTYIRNNPGSTSVLYFAIIAHSTKAEQVKAITEIMGQFVKDQ